MSRVVEWSIKNSGSSVQRPLSFESRRAWRKRPESGSTIPGLPARLVAITLQNTVVPDSVRPRNPAPGRSGHPQLGGQPRGRSQARHDASVRVKEGPEELVAAAGGADQVQVFEHHQAGMAAGFAFTNRCRLLDHRPDRRDQVEVAGAAIVALEAPGNQCGLVDGRRLPFGNAVQRVLLEPVEERAMALADLVEPLIDAAADRGVADSLHGAADPDRVARPAVGTQPAIEARGDAAPLGVGVQRRRQGRAPQMNGVSRLGEVEIGDRLDEIVPFLGGGVLDQVEIGRTKPVEGRAEPVLERPSIAAPSRERAADQHVDRHAAAGGELDRTKENRLVGAGRLALDVALAVQRQCELDRRIASQLAIGMDMAAVDRQQRPVDVVPAQAHVAHAAIDFGLHVDRENRTPRLGPVVLDQEALDVLAGRLFAARVQRQAIADGGEVGDHDLDRPVPPGQLRRQEVGRSLVLLVGVPGGPFGEPVEPASDGEAADDPAEMAAALRQIAFPGTDVGMKADRRKINVVGRAAPSTRTVINRLPTEPFGSREQRIHRFGAVRQVGTHDRVLIGTLGGQTRPRARRSRDNGAERRPPAAESGACQKLLPPLFSIQ